jgi:hypothetical protein
LGALFWLVYALKEVRAQNFVSAVDVAIYGLAWNNFWFVEGFSFHV